MATHMALKFMSVGIGVTGYAKVLVFTWPSLKGYEGDGIIEIKGGCSIWTPMFSIPAGTPYDLDQLLNREVKVAFEPQPRVIGSGPCEVSFKRWKKRKDGTYKEDGAFTLGMTCKGGCLDAGQIV